jgi:hypothetical protein
MLADIGFATIFALVFYLAQRSSKAHRSIGRISGETPR